jgi:Tfp pilus assembly protein PilN
MTIEIAELDQLQTSYKEAVDAWIAAIRHEAALALVNHSVAQIDQWERAAEQEQTARETAKAAKVAYEDALRKEFFHF